MNQLTLMVRRIAHKFDKTPLPPNARLLCEWLRSGLYEQPACRSCKDQNESLRFGPAEGPFTYTPFGVICDLHMYCAPANGYWKRAWLRPSNSWWYVDQFGDISTPNYLSEAVRRWIGFKTSSGSYIDLKTGERCCSIEKITSYPRPHASFREVADLIESRPPELFATP